MCCLHGLATTGGSSAASHPLPSSDGSTPSHAHCTGLSPSTKDCVIYRPSKHISAVNTMHEWILDSYTACCGAPCRFCRINLPWGSRLDDYQIIHIAHHTAPEPGMRGRVYQITYELAVFTWSMCASGLLAFPERPISAQPESRSRMLPSWMAPRIHIRRVERTPLPSRILSSGGVIISFHVASPSQIEEVS